VVRGVILTGPLGVGKTHALRVLTTSHGFWTPRELTTRPVDTGSTSHGHVSEDSFIQRAKEGDIVMPAHFAGQWYGWPRSDFERLLSADGLAALDVRPYTALILASVIETFKAIWLWAAPDVLMQRRLSRRELRDQDEAFRAYREQQDAYDAAYERLFKTKIRADEDIVNNILSVVANDDY
jgi:guanylate kinase